jgi:hypothetical protein
MPMAVLFNPRECRPLIFSSPFLYFLKLFAIMKSFSGDGHIDAILDAISNTPFLFLVAVPKI